MENQNEKNTNRELLRKILRQIQTNVRAALELLEGGESSAARVSDLLSSPNSQYLSPNSRTIEGAFDGQKMIGEDGQTYSVPPNYASKSNLVSGDRLKLIITASGRFIFKQIGPMERERIVGLLALDPATRQFIAAAGEKSWKLLTASVTFYHGEPGDEVVILVPKFGEVAWAAVENVVKK